MTNQMLICDMMQRAQSRAFEEDKTLARFAYWSSRQATEAALETMTFADDEALRVVGVSAFVLAIIPASCGWPT